MSIVTEEKPGDLLTIPDALSYEALQALTRREALMVRVPEFMSAAQCDLIARGLRGQGYGYVSGWIGTPFPSLFQFGATPDGIDHYYATALPNIRGVRDACTPYPSPIDVFRCVVDELWPSGASLQALSGRKMFVGLCCNARPRIPLLAQHDFFARLVRHDPKADDLLMQMAVNVYVDVPQQGGELMMWRDEITDAEFLRRRGDKYGMDIEPLGVPDIVVKPQMGDLILFNTRKLHAVAPGSGSDCLTLSCHLGFRGDDQPLTFWS